MVRIAANRGPFSPTCLTRSLALWWLLRRRGIAGKLRLGARQHEGRFEAHAWIELDGEIVNDSPDISDRYPVLGTPENTELSPTGFRAEVSHT